MSINSANYPYIDKKARKRAIRRKSYLKNRQKEIDRAKLNNKLNRPKRDIARKHVAEVKLNSKCGFCNCDVPDCLDFHHVDASEKKFGIYEAVSRRISLESIRQEIAKCVTLCSNHHRLLHAALRMKDYNADLLKKLLEL